MFSKYNLFSILALICLSIACFSVKLQAQKSANSPITVQYADGTTSYYNTLDETLAALKSGCIVYIPAGHYSVSDKEETKIKCQVAIYGSGCRKFGKDMEFTRIKGSLRFAEGSSSSTLQGIFSENDVDISANVHNLLIKNVDVSHIYFTNSTNYGCMVNSSVIRYYIDGNSAPVEVHNCLAGNIKDIQNGAIANCILKPSSSDYYSYPYYDGCSNCDIYNNIGLDTNWGRNSNRENCNMVGSDGAQIAYPKEGLKALFVKYDPNHPFDLSRNDYHLKQGVAGTNAGTDGKDIGIYGGNGFDDSGRAPVAKITIKEIAPQTDKDGKLKVKIEVLSK